MFQTFGHVDAHFGNFFFKFLLIFVFLQQTLEPDPWYEGHVIFCLNILWGQGLKIRQHAIQCCVTVCGSMGARRPI